MHNLIFSAAPLGAAASAPRRPSGHGLADTSRAYQMIGSRSARIQFWRHPTRVTRPLAGSDMPGEPYGASEVFLALL
jgi:hypothetical protein